MAYRIKDFIYMKVYDVNGEFLGRVKDLSINYNEEKVTGFIVTPRFLSKKNYIPIEKLVSIDGCIIVYEVEKREDFKFNDLKSLDVVTKEGKILGVVEDLIVELKNFSIKGLIISTGFLDKLLSGKKIILLKETILGENGILYFGNENLILKSIPHNFFKRNENYES